MDEPRLDAGVLFSDEPHDGQACGGGATLEMVSTALMVEDRLGMPGKPLKVWKSQLMAFFGTGRGRDSDDAYAGGGGRSLLTLLLLVLLVLLTLT